MLVIVCDLVCCANVWVLLRGFPGCCCFPLDQSQSVLALVCETRVLPTRVGWTDFALGGFGSVDSLPSMAILAHLSCVGTYGLRDRCLCDGLSCFTLP